MIWVLEKIEKDINQNIYNLKKAGFKDNSYIIKRLKDLKKEVESYTKAE